MRVITFTLALLCAVMVRSAEIQKILFLGNSITLHSPAPDIGWYGNWGMAASAADMDYVHRVVTALSGGGSPPEALVKNIAGFERQFATYDTTALVNEAAAFNPDVIVVAIGENVPALTNPADKAAFAEKTVELIEAIRADRQTLIVVRSCFWANALKDEALKTACQAVGGIFANIGTLHEDEANYARSERDFTNAGVGAHPGDRGMRAIADVIVSSIRKAQNLQSGVLPAKPRRMKLGAYYYGGWSGQCLYDDGLPEHAWAVGMPKGYTKKLATTFSGRMPLWGWREDTPEVTEQQIDLAADHGLAFFAYCWFYRDDQGPINVEAIEQASGNQAVRLFMEADNNSRMEFCLLVANHAGARIEGETAWRQASDYWISTYFGHPRYLRMDGKPVIIIFNTAGSDAAGLAYLQQAAINAGFPGVWVAGCGTATAEKGYQIATRYNLRPGKDTDNVALNCSEMNPFHLLADWNASNWDAGLATSLPRIPLATQGWDCRPWEAPDGLFPSGAGATPHFARGTQKEFEGYLRNMAAWMDDHPDKVTQDRLGLVYAWNEIGEGGWLMPCVDEPEGIYLKAIRSAVFDDWFDYSWESMARQSWWNFDEPSGQALDSVSEIHSASVSGAVRVPGKVRTAFSFDGLDDCINFTTNLAHLAGALTVSAWVKPITPPVSGRVIAGTYSSSMSRGWSFGPDWGSGDRMNFRVHSPQGYQAVATYPGFFAEHTNKWVHVAGVFRPGESVELYVNGVLVGYQPTTLNAIGTTNVNFRIGRRQDNGQAPWSGLIDEVRVFGAAVPSDEVPALLFGAGGRWRFDVPPDSGNTAQDSVADNDGTLCGGVARMAGKVNNALSFDGAGDYVSFTTNLAHLAGALTVSAWVKPITPPVSGRVIAGTFSSSMSRGWSFGPDWGSGDRMNFRILSPQGYQAVATYPGFFAEHTNKWAHVAGVFRPGESVELYVNGVLVTNVPTSVTAIGTTNVNFRIGSRQDTGQAPWDGLIDEVAVYDGAKAPAAVKTECLTAPNLPPDITGFSVSPTACRADETVVLEATGTDTDDRIARVRFYAGETVIATCTNEPYRFEWKNHGAGAYPVFARFFDMYGGVSTSAAVTVTLESMLSACAAGHWRFDVPPDSGNTAQDSVADNDGTLGGSGGVPARVDGKFGKALSFDGSDDCVDFTTNLAHLAGALTVSAWVKPEAPPVSGRVIAGTFSSSMSRGWSFGPDWGSGDRMNFRILSPQGYQAVATYPGFFAEHTNKWTHVAGVFRPGASVELYVNGVLVTNVPTSVTAIGTTNVNFQIGRRQDTGQAPWSGLIDEVRAFGAALPQDELDALCSAPAGEWLFEEADGYPYATNSLSAALFRGEVYAPTHRTSGGYGGSRALTFDGSADRVSFTTNLAHLSGALTVSAWVKPDRPPSASEPSGRIIANTYHWSSVAENQRGWLLGKYWGATDSLQFTVYSPDGSPVSAACYNFFRDWSNKWVHVAGVFKAANSAGVGYVALYTNGVPVGTPTPTAFTAIGYDNTNLRIGMRADNTTQGQWSGLIDEVRIYEGALPLFAVQALSAGEPAALPGILNVPGVSEEPAGPRKATILLVR